MKPKAQFPPRSARSVPDPIRASLNRALARMRRMTVEERRKALVRAGILTRSGQLTRPYRSLSQE